jgi:hypothetical protein
MGLTSGVQGVNPSPGNNLEYSQEWSYARSLDEVGRLIGGWLRVPGGVPMASHSTASLARLLPSLGPTFTRGRPRNHDQLGDTLCNHVLVHPIADTRARVPEPVFPPGPAAPTACTVPGAMVSHGRPPVLGWHLPRPLARGAALGYTVANRRPAGARAVLEGPSAWLYRSGAQPDLVVNCSPQSSVALYSAPGRAMSTRHGRLVPPFQRPSLVPPAAQDFRGFPERSLKGEGCGTCHRAPRPQKTSPSVVIRSSLEQDLDTVPGQQLCRPAPNVAPTEKSNRSGPRAPAATCRIPAASPAIRPPGEKGTPYRRWSPPAPVIGSPRHFESRPFAGLAGVVGRPDLHEQGCHARMSGFISQSCRWRFYAAGRLLAQLLTVAAQSVLARFGMSPCNGAAAPVL